MGAPAVSSGSTADAAAVADDADWNEEVAAREQLRGLDRFVGAGGSFNLAALSLLPADGNVPVVGSEPVRLLGGGAEPSVSLGAMPPSPGTGFVLESGAEPVCLLGGGPEPPDGPWDPGVKRGSRRLQGGGRCRRQRRRHRHESWLLA